MSTVATPEPTSTTYPLSPFQRAALTYQRRPQVLTVELSAAPDSLGQRAEAAVSASPELTATLHSVPGLRIPRQSPNPPASQSLPGGGWLLTAGSLHVRAEPCASGTRLTIASDAIVADARSLGLLLDRIVDSSFLAAPVNFFKVAAGHAAMAQEGQLDQEKRYWQPVTCVEDVRAALGSAHGSSAGRVTVSRSIDAPLTAQLAEFAKAQNVNVSDVLYLGLHLLLNRVCPDGAVLGRLVDARELMGFESVSGPFTQVVPDMADIERAETSLALLARQVERLSRHEEMAGGAALTEESPAPTVIFDPETDWILPSGWRLVDAFEARSGALMLRGRRQRTGLCLIADACENEDPGPLRTILHAWAEIVTAVARNPHSPWKTLKLGIGLDPDASAGVPLASTDRSAAQDVCARVYELAAQDPHAPAVRYGTEIRTRRALLCRIGDLSEAFGRLDPGAVVAVLADPEPDLLAGWLAALWQGAVFLPLSTTEPRQRIEQAIRDSGASVVLAGTDAQTFTAPIGCRVVFGREVGTTLRIPGPPRPAGQDHPAYLMRTSGSTGTPKLVSIGRTSLNNYLRWVDEEILSDGAELPALSSPIFDASLKQLLGPQYARRVTWLLRADRADTAQVHAELAAHDRPVSLNCVPSYWAELIEAGRTSETHLPLRRLLLGGEAVSEALLRRTAREYPAAEIWNLYGPTETTATATAGRLLPGEPVHAGTAVAGAFVTVADTEGRVLPDGMRGEVWIAGPGRASAYLGSVDQSCFASLRLGELLVPAYRTGDFGRLDERGRLYLDGRLDRQLKVRGWRIEPAEIEHVAASAPGVTSATVVLDDRKEQAQLRLFYLGEADEAAVIEVLHSLMPTPIIPASVTRIDRFPRTDTGKIDHRQLLASMAERVEASPEDYDLLELEIATIWRHVLGTWPATDEEFFSAGGHSLQLARLVNQLRALGHRSLSLRQVVRSPTVNSIAALIRAAEAS